jgi:hypothetical protein
MTPFLPKNLFLLSASALVLCMTIAAGTAHAKDTESAATGTLKNRQIVVEPATEKQTPLKSTETVENAPAPKAEAPTPEEQPAADDGDDVTQAPKEEPSQPVAAPKTPHGPSTVYVLRYAGDYGHGYGYGYHHYRPAYDYDDAPAGNDYEGSGYGHESYEHCDD